MTSIGRTKVNMARRWTKSDKEQLNKGLKHDITYILRLDINYTCKKIETHQSTYWITNIQDENAQKEGTRCVINPREL